MYKVVGPKRVVVEVRGESKYPLFELEAHVERHFVVLRSGETGDSVPINLDQISAVVAALQRGKDILDKGLDPVIEVE